MAFLGTTTKSDFRFPAAREQANQSASPRPASHLAILPSQSQPPPNGNTAPESAAGTALAPAAEQPVTPLFAPCRPGAAR